MRWAWIVFLLAGAIRALAQQPADSVRLLTPVAAEPIHRMFAVYDADGDGRLAFEEWSRFVIEPSNAFLDTDRDGFLSEAEFGRSVLTVNASQRASYDHGATAAMETGKRLALMDDPASGARSYEEVRHSTPDLVLAHLGAGRCLDRVGLHQAAAEAYTMCLARDPTVAEAWLNLALVEDRLTRPESLPHLWYGLQMLETGVRLRNPGACLAAERAHACDVVASIVRYFEEDGHNPELAARVKVWKESHLDALPPPPEQPLDATRTCHVSLLVEHGRAAEALASLEKALAGTPGEGRLWMLRAGTETALGLYEKARFSLEQARAHKVTGAVLEALTVGNFLDRGRQKEAQELAEKLDPASMTIWEKEELAWQLTFRGDWGTAEPWVQRALADRHDLQRACILMALCLRGRGALGQAVDLLRELQTPLLTNPSMLRMQARLCLELGNLTPAAEVASEAVRLQPLNIFSRLQMAAVLARTGSQRQRLEVLKEAFELTTEQSPGRLLLLDELRRAAVAANAAMSATSATTVMTR